MRDDRIDIDPAPVRAPRRDEAFGGCAIHCLCAHILSAHDAALPRLVAGKVAKLAPHVNYIDFKTRQLLSAIVSITAIHAAAPARPDAIERLAHDLALVARRRLFDALPRSGQAQAAWSDAARATAAMSGACAPATD